MADDRVPEHLRALVALVRNGMPVRLAGPQVGMSHDQAKHQLAKHGIKVLDLRGTLPPGCARGTRHRAMSEKQAQALDKQRAIMKASYARKHPLPPVSDEEAARLVAEAIAAGRVTRCPPAPDTIGPINFGVGFR